MKKLLFIIPLLAFTLQGNAQREFTYSQDDTVYTMKRYVFMLLNSGDNTSQDSIEAMKIQKLHLAHLDSLAGTGKLIMAGPFQDGGIHRGLLLFDVDTVEEALKLEAEDPAVRAGRLKMEAFFWWGAKGTVLN